MGVFCLDAGVRNSQVLETNCQLVVVEFQSTAGACDVRPCAMDSMTHEQNSEGHHQPPPATDSDALQTYLFIALDNGIRRQASSTGCQFVHR